MTMKTRALLVYSLLLMLVVAARQGIASPPATCKKIFVLQKGRPAIRLNISPKISKC
jgi:hypothetical protein